MTLPIHGYVARYRSMLGLPPPISSCPCCTHGVLTNPEHTHINLVMNPNNSLYLEINAEFHLVGVHRGRHGLCAVEEDGLVRTALESSFVSLQETASGKGMERDVFLV